MNRKRKSKPELKIYSFFSAAAVEVGLKTEDVEEVYFWAMRDLKNQIMTKPTLSIHITGLGKFVTDKRTIMKEAFMKVYLLRRYCNTFSPGEENWITMENHAKVLVRSLDMIKKLRLTNKYKNYTTNYNTLSKQLEIARKAIRGYDAVNSLNILRLKSDEQFF